MPSPKRSPTSRAEVVRVCEAMLCLLRRAEAGKKKSEECMDQSNLELLRVGQELTAALNRYESCNEAC